MNITGIPTEIYFVWKEWVIPEGEDKPRLITPWGNPYRHEFPFDLLFDSPEAAVKGKIEWEVETIDKDSKNWILCKETIEPIKY